MGILGRLAFWKKKDEFAGLGLGDRQPNLGKGFDPNQGMVPGLGNDMGFGSEFGSSFSSSSSNFNPGANKSSWQQPQSFELENPQRPSFPQSVQQPQWQQPSYPPQNTRDYEVISAKLDSLRATMDSINQRLANIEAIARGEEERPRRRW